MFVLQPGYRLAIFAGFISRYRSNLGLPDNCEVVTEPLDVLTDLAVLFTFSLAQVCCCCCFLHINRSGLNHTQ